MRHLIEDFFVIVIDTIYNVIYDIDRRLGMIEIDEHKVIKNKVVDILCDVVFENIETFLWGLGAIVVYGHWKRYDEFEEIVNDGLKQLVEMSMKE